MPDIRKWLDDLGLSRYAQAFADNEIDLAALRHLTDADLKDIGVALGSRRKILAAIETAPRADPTPLATDLSPGAERRQLTVVFCDLVGSTALSESLDPEDLRAVMAAYRETVGAVVARYDGHVAQYLGDGVMAYFGWPRAHEDDAERSIRAGLDILDAVGDIELAGLVHGAADRRDVQVRLGISTGPVVVGADAGDGAEGNRLAVGETPNLAARFQELAAAGQVIVGPVTRRLAGGVFAYRDLGLQELKGVVDPVRAWRVTGASTAQGRFDARSADGLTPLIGRDLELDLLVDRWRQAKDGEGHVVLLSGEPGIGKSRLLRELRERVADDAHIRLRYHCSPFHTNSTFHPIIGQLTRAAGFDDDDTTDDKLDKLEALLGQSTDDLAATAPLFAAMVSLPVDRYPPLNLSPQKLKELTIQMMADQIAGLARHKPVLMLVEDVHWCDPSTLDSLSVSIDAIQDVPALMVITFRPTFTPTWTGHGHVSSLALSRLGRRQVADMVRRVAGERALPAPVMDQIVGRTDGVPLFVEELTKSVVEAAVMPETAERATAAAGPPDLVIPSTLRDSLMARLDRMASVKEVAQIGACLGREFSYELIAVLTQKTDAELSEGLQKLIDSELIFGRGQPPDAHYRFKHALVQDVAYESLLKTSRQQHHARIVEALKNKHPGLSDTEPELLAHHYSEAGQAESAVVHWHKAAQRAMQRSAHIEAERHLRTGLQMLANVPDAASRNRLEIALQNTLGVCLMPTRGFGDPEVSAAFTKAAAVSEREGDARGLFVALRGQGQYQMISGDLRSACEQTVRILRLAEQLDDPGLIIESHHLGWSALAFTGDYEAARAHVEAAIGLYQPDQHHHLTHTYSGHDPGVCARSFGSLSLWQLGLPDQAAAMCQGGLALAEELGHPFSIAVALWGAALMSMVRRDVEMMRDIGARFTAHCTEHGFKPFIPMGRVFEGGARAAAGDIDRGIVDMREGLAGVRASGTRFTVPTCHAWLADACISAGRLEAAAATLDDGIALATDTADRFMMPEFHRIRGELRLAGADPDGAAAAFGAAADAARVLHAKTLELRATLSLARLRQTQNRPGDARGLLAPVIAGFTEGFETADLTDAKRLFETLEER